MNITAADRKSLIRMASALPKGSEERKGILGLLLRHKTSSKEVQKSLDFFSGLGPHGGLWGWPFSKSKVEKAVRAGAALDVIAKVIEEGDDDLPRNADRKTRDLWDWMNEEMM